ncbi:baeRF2 domain-containing protein [Streptomonospora litoralis]|uniref:Peptide chain release factor 1 n=1 Tax=Streptomonospora litoralis TaxID=2498135 RepID=A0A4P6Q1L3_9ACTN|nr:Vms1/Ankzf1 family peptidyl-tRNA hydrolase [Streptomonospora litoralis]QBI53121.1 hypothetical protein EKD16_06615 [Streptomonospora litoralis]
MDLSFLTSVEGTSGPIASLNINNSRDAEDADHEVHVRWQKAREDLRSQGADESTLGAMDGIVGQTGSVAGAHGQVIFAADGRVLLDTVVSEPPQDYLARVGPLPDPLLYIYSQRTRIPYVLAVVDSQGGDVRTVYGDGRTVHHRVEGENWPVNKVREGGYHHNQMQRNVDNQVAENAGRVAGAAAQEAKRNNAEVVAIAGEVQVRGELRDRLPDWLEPRALDLESGSRASGSEKSPLEEELRRHLEERAQSQVAEVQESFQQGKANRDRAVEGFAAVVRALQRGQVDTLLWSTGLAETDIQVWIGPSGEEIALDEQELREMGVDEPATELAGPAILRAAAATSAQLIMVPQNDSTAEDGIGAILRFSDPALDH